MLRVNKELNTRKNLPKLAATIARGRFNLNDTENVKPKPENVTELKRSKSVSDLLIPPPPPLISSPRQRYILKTPAKDKSKKDDHLKHHQQSMFSRLFRSKSGGRPKKNKTRKTKQFKR
jgi:hypothetical protein